MDVIAKMLQPLEKDRISWQELIKNSIFDQIARTERKTICSFSQHDKK
jgi:hypothetical protein